MKARVEIDYRTKGGNIGTWRGDCEGKDLSTMGADCTARLKKRIPRINRIDRVHVVLAPAPVTLEVRDRQDVATILAALQYYRDGEQGEPDRRENHIHDLATEDDSNISADDKGVASLFKLIQGQQ